MKSLMSSLALAVSMGLCSVALADNGCSSCGQADSCCGHGLLSRLRLHRGNDCCENTQTCGNPCDSCGGHRLTGWIGRMRMGHGCGSCGSCGGCETQTCAPRCCRPRIALCHRPRCETSCDSCGGCGGGHLSRLRGLLHRDSCCGTSSCGSCGGCGGGCGGGLHGLFGRRCNSCESSCNGCSGNGCSGTTVAPSSAPAPAPVPAPAPAPKPSASSNGLLILTPAG
jgi:hypothetical protein